MYGWLRGICVFIIQMKNCKFFKSNRAIYSEFADALIEAEKLGMNIRTLNRNVTSDELTIDKSVEIKIGL